MVLTVLFKYNVVSVRTPSKVQAKSKEFTGNATQRFGEVHEGHLPHNYST